MTQTTAGELHMTKECSEYTGLAGSFCTITASNIEAVPVGSKVVYDSAAGEKSIDSDLSIRFGDERLLSGHVVFDLVNNTGTLVLTGDAGVLDGFHADAAVSSDGGAEASWDGTYTVSLAGATTPS